VTTPRSPTVRRRRLAAELHRLRGSRTGEEIARELGWSASKVSRYELGRTGLKPSEVERLLDLYGVVDPDRSRLLALAHDATQKGWWEDYADAIADEYMTFIGLETEAMSVSHWEVDVVPGLLQTEQYATQVHASYQNVVPIPPGIIQKRVKVRMLRQQALTREEPLDFSVVLDESVLLRKIADSSAMRAQLMHLAELADRPNVRLQVLPFSARRSVIASSFVIFRFGPTGDATLHDVVTTENFTSEFYVQGETNTYEHRLAFDSLAADALAPTESQELIVRTAEHVWT
jgi:transcriptional regulator with XRE-family HTH domain